MTNANDDHTDPIGELKTLSSKFNRLSRKYNRLTSLTVALVALLETKGVITHKEVVKLQRQCGPSETKTEIMKDKP